MESINYRIKSGDAMIYAQVCGQGVPLILLHGNGEDLHYFEYQIPLLSKYYKVIAIDTRAHGQSTDGKCPLNFTLLAEDVIAVMDELSIDKAHILGFSDGGNTALHIAITYPQRLISLILNGANLFPNGIKMNIRIVDLLYYSVCTIFSPFHPRIRKRREFLSLMVNHPHIMPQQLQQIQAPTLVIAGENDMIKTIHTELIAKSIPNSELIIIPDADHFAAKKMPEIFNPMILKFLNKYS